jgi:hypothetical protein
VDGCPSTKCWSGVPKPVVKVIVVVTAVASVFGIAALVRGLYLDAIGAADSSYCRSHLAIIGLAFANVAVQSVKPI